MVEPGLFITDTGSTSKKNDFCSMNRIAKINISRVMMLFSSVFPYNCKRKLSASIEEGNSQEYEQNRGIILQSVIEKMNDKFLIDQAVINEVKTAEKQCCFRKYGTCSDQGEKYDHGVNPLSMA